MTTRKIACPSCQVGLKIAEATPPGKEIVCPKCSSPFPVPPRTASLAQGSVKRATRAAAAPASPDEEEGEAEDRPAPRKRKKKLKKKKQAQGSSTAMIVGVFAVLLLVGGGIGVAIGYWPASDGKSAPALAQNNSRLPAPEPAAARGPAEPGDGAGPAASRGRGSEEGGAGSRESRPRRPRGGDQGEPGSAPPPGGTAAGGGGDRGAPETPEPMTPAAPSSADSRMLAAGRRVFDANCTRCHALGGGSGGGGPGGRGRGPDLSHVGADPTHTAAWIAEHIRNPKAHSPNSRMPAFEGRIQPNDLRALAEYLASLK